MSEALPEGPAVPESEARSPVTPPVQGTAPAWESPDPVDLPEALAPDVTTPELPSESTPERGAMTGTAERIGSAVGTAQRQWRRGLELVRRPIARPSTEVDVSEITIQSADDDDFTAGAAPRVHTSRVVDPNILKEIEEEVSNARRVAALRLDKWSERAGARFQQFRRQARTSLRQSQQRAREFANVYPLQTIALIAGVSFGLGVAMRFRRSRRG